MLTNKEVIIFDMDGTLIDSVGVWNEVDCALLSRLNKSMSITYEEAQIQRDTMLRKFSKDENPYMSYCAYLKERYNSPLSVEEIHDLRYEIAGEYLRNVIDYKEGADKFIKKLKSKGYTLVIASTTKGSNMEIYKKENANIIKKARLEDYFSLIYTREDASEIKPNPEIYLKVMKTLNKSPKACLVFEDSLIGVEAAKAAGIETVAVYDKYSDSDREKIDALADYKIESYKELI